MDLEDRYAVFKRADVEALLDPVERDVLAVLEAKMARRRIAKGRVPLACVVVESDWPEYEPTCKAIAGRMDVEHG